jgi:1-acyl-sn-glycerol-3-phosphate acyltransferase
MKYNILKEKPTLTKSKTARGVKESKSKEKAISVTSRQKIKAFAKQVEPRKSVLGNDPFSDIARMAPEKVAIRKETFPQTPELQTPKRAKIKFEPVLHAHTPRGADPIPHAETPQAIEMNGAVSHHASPSIFVDPIAHPDAPTSDIEKNSQPAIDSSAFGVLRGALSAIKVAAGFGSGQSQLDQYGKDVQLTRQLAPLAHLLYEKYWRVEVKGAKHVPNGPCLIIANHAGAWPLDGPVTHLALSRERRELKKAYWLLEDQIFHSPMVGLLANRLGAVRANPENAMHLLAQGHPVIVFPEGYQGLSKPISERYQLKRFGRGGYVKIALAAGVPIVPLAIVGAEESMPLLGTIPAKMLGIDHLPITVPPLPVKWHLEFGEPMYVQEGSNIDPSTPALSFVEKKNDEVKLRIESMIESMLQQRSSIF